MSALNYAIKVLQRYSTYVLTTCTCVERKHDRQMLQRRFHSRFVLLTHLSSEVADIEKPFSPFLPHLTAFEEEEEEEEEEEKEEEEVDIADGRRGGFYYHG